MCCGQDIYYLPNRAVDIGYLACKNGFMNSQWTTYQAWIAHFDILGFKSIIKNESASLSVNIVKSKLDQVIEKLKKDTSDFGKNVEYLFYADTFIIYSKSDRISCYPELIRVSKNFINTCIYKKLPVRGAVSFGDISFRHDKRILMGKAFLESYVYGEDQNWLGLLLTPSASKELLQNGLEPSRHGFINRDIPLRKYSIFDDSIYAYCFINGSTNFQCPLLPALNEMMHMAPAKDKIKYENTIKFIEKYYTVQSNS